jgi:hypothetical protein
MPVKIKIVRELGSLMEKIEEDEKEREEWESINGISNVISFVGS